MKKINALSCSDLFLGGDRGCSLVNVVVVLRVLDAGDHFGRIVLRNQHSNRSFCRLFSLSSTSPTRQKLGAHLPSSILFFSLVITKTLLALQLQTNLFSRTNFPLFLPKEKRGRNAYFTELN